MHRLSTLLLIGSLCLCSLHAEDSATDRSKPISGVQSSRLSGYLLRGKMFKSSQERLASKDDTAPDVADTWTFKFTPMDNVDDIVGVDFTVDTAYLDWDDTQCEQNHEYCKDFIDMFGCEQQVIGSVNGGGFTTVSNYIETGESFHFSKGYKYFNDVKTALKAGTVSCIIRTSIREDLSAVPYRVAQFKVEVQTQ